MVLQLEVDPDSDGGQATESIILKVVVSTFHASAILLTCFRLWYRMWKRQLWWEDAWASVALIAETVSLVSIWLILAAPPGDAGRIIAYWHLVIAFTVCLWSARLSVICSIVRFAPRGCTLRKLAIISTATFAMMLLSLLIQKIYHCAHDTRWYALDPITCDLDESISATQLATDVISDLILVVLPIQLIRDGSVPRDQRIMVLSVFSSSILISLISIVHFIFLIEPDTYSQVITGQVEIALSVIVCNLLVIVICVYKLLRRNEQDGAQGLTRSRTVYLTTILDTGELGSRRDWSSAESAGKLTLGMLEGRTETNEPEH